MPTYEYKCKDCQHIEEVVHAISETSQQVCPKCGKAMDRLISFNPTGFVMKCGSPMIHQREKERRKKKSMEMESKMLKKYGRVSPRIKPNIAGVETGSWSDAQKMAREAGMNHESFTPWVEREKKEKKGL